LPAADTPLIDLANVDRWYGSFHALKGVTLRLPPGRIGLLGPNGAGKSSLLKILLGLLPPSSGGGRFLGQDLRGDGAALRRSVGYMPESEALIPGLRGAEYVALAGELYGMPRIEAQRRAHEVLTYLGLEDARYRYLDEYSTGMKQRIKLAQALVHDPPVLLLDEPTSGLDPAGREAMLNLLLTLGREYGKSMLLCTHLLGDVERVCETVVILNKGQVVRQGSVAELRTRRQDRYRLRVQGEVERFVKDLSLEGVELLHDNGRGELRVAVPAGWLTRTFFALADNNNVLLRGLECDDERLEELFHRVLAETNGQSEPRPSGSGGAAPLPDGRGSETPAKKNGAEESHAGNP
jgi:ABC-2 type transport system ATP-binding protein